jgi:serine/threonine protein kinase
MLGDRAGTCPNEDAINAFVHGALPDSRVAEIDEHLAACPVCRHLVAAAARSLRGESREDTPPSLKKEDHLSLVSSSGGASVPPLLSAGTEVGRYIIQDRIGVGGMGVVYGGWDPQLNRQVTLKLLHHISHFAQAQLLREAQAMAQLSHPNVVAIYDVGSYGNQVFMAMEHVDGKTLAQWLRDEQPDWKQVLDAFYAAGRGLASAHARGIVHRDFKPSNVLIGRDGRVRVADFGLARPVDHVATQKMPAIDGETESLSWDSIGDLTATGVLKGTPAYMAPEQFRGQRSDARSDQFSFCVALYRALYRRRPFDGQDLADLRRRVTQGSVTPPPDDGNLPAAIGPVLLRGLSARSSDRFRTLDELLSALSEAARPRRVDPPRRAGWRLAIVAAAGVAAAVLIFGGYLIVRSLGGSQPVSASTARAAPAAADAFSTARGTEALSARAAAGPSTALQRRAPAASVEEHAGEQRPGPASARRRRRARKASELRRGRPRSQGRQSRRPAATSRPRANIPDKADRKPEAHRYGRADKSRSSYDDALLEPSFAPE